MTINEDITGWAGEYELHHENRNGNPVPPSNRAGTWNGYFTGDWDGSSSGVLANAKRTVESRIAEMAQRLGVTDLVFLWTEHTHNGRTWCEVDVDFRNGD